MDSLKRSSLESPTGRVELDRLRRGVAQGFADRGGQLGHIEQQLIFVRSVDLGRGNGITSPGVQRFYGQLVAVAAAAQRAGNYCPESLADRNQTRGLLVERCAGVRQLPS